MLLFTLLGGTIAGAYYLIPDVPAVSPVATEVVEDITIPPEIKITVLKTVHGFATVYIDIPESDDQVQLVKTTMQDGTLIVELEHSDIEKHVPIFPDSKATIYHSEGTTRNIKLEVQR